MSLKICKDQEKDSFKKQYGSLHCEGSLEIH